MSEVLNNFLIGYNNLSDIQNKRLLACNKNGLKVVCVILGIIIIACTLFIILYIKKENNKLKESIMSYVDNKNDLTFNKTKILIDKMTNNNIDDILNSLSGEKNYSF